MSICADDKKERHPLNPSLKVYLHRTRIRHYNVCTGTDAAVWKGCPVVVDILV